MVEQRPADLMPVLWAVERPIHDEISLSNRGQMIVLIHDLYERLMESIPENGYRRTPGPVYPILFMQGGKRIARMECPVLPVAPADDVIPL